MKQSDWNRVRAKLKKKHERAGITHCQLCGSHSGGPLGFSFAHRIKRRFIQDEQELSVAALLCTSPCHSTLEHGPKERMFEVITNLIERDFGVRP